MVMTFVVVVYMGCAGWVLGSKSVAEVTTTADETIPHVITQIHTKPGVQTQLNQTQEPTRSAMVMPAEIRGDGDTALDCRADPK
jgi:hypothetical protein